MKTNSFVIRQALAAELPAVREIFLEYLASLSVDTRFQNVEAELASLPGAYAQPEGALLLALQQAQLVGCCALRALPPDAYANAAEMKRLYVRPAFRGQGLGRQLAEAALDAARQSGYRCVLLDTLSDMEAARALYEDLGFTEIPAFYDNPLSGAHYLKVDV
ncbi:MAG: GNAT family N-acetyltransferase [Burkholderiaceae bacterium]